MNIEYVPLQRCWVSKNKSREKVFEFWLSKVTFHICQMGEKHFRWVSPFPPWDVANPVTKSNFSVSFFTFSSHFHWLAYMICDGSMMHYALHYFLSSEEKSLNKSPIMVFSMLLYILLLLCLAIMWKFKDNLSPRLSLVDRKETWIYFLGAHKTMEKLRNCGLWEKKKKSNLWPLEEERKTKGARTVSLPRECIFNLFIKLKLKCRKKVFSFLLLTRRSILGQGDRRQSVSITVFLYKLFIYNIE